MQEEVHGHKDQEEGKGLSQLIDGFRRPEHQHGPREDDAPARPQDHRLSEETSSSAACSCDRTSLTCFCSILSSSQATPAAAGSRSPAPAGRLPSLDVPSCVRIASARRCDSLRAKTAPQTAIAAIINSRVNTAG